MSFKEDFRWNDSSLLDKDYLYLSEVYEETLTLLLVRLNNMHGVNFDRRFWEIYIGIWLKYFIQILFSRLSNLSLRSKYLENSKPYFNVDMIERFCPNDTGEFNSLVRGNEWNNFIINVIAAIKEGGLISGKELGVTKCTNHSTAKVQFSSYLKDLLPKAKYFFVKFALRKQKYFIYESHLSKKDLIKLSFKLKDFSCMFSRNARPSPRLLGVKCSSYDGEKRSWKLEYKESDNFKHILSSIIPMQFPKSYIEGFASNLKDCDSAGYPKSPKVILTTVSILHNDSFKLWSALKVHYGAKLIIWQHGGHYGTGKINTQHDHEISICDKYISWGWGGKFSKIAPMGLPLKWRSGKVIRNLEKRILLVMTDGPINGAYIMSYPNGLQWGMHHKYILDLCTKLHHRYQSSLSVRPEPSDYGWHVKEKFLSSIPSLKIETSEVSFVESVNNSMISIFTSNLTTFLESLFMDRPTLLILPLGFWEIKKDAELDFSFLQRVGILHYDSKSLLSHLKKIEIDIDDWWLSDDVRKCVSLFKRNYARENKNLINELTYIMRD